MKSRQQLVVDLLFLSLKVKNAALNEHAAEVLRRTGPELTRRLVLEAASRKNSLGYRLRLLGVVERIGELSGVDDWVDLNLLAADKNPQIRHAAAGCLAAHSPVRVTPDADG